MRFRWIRIDGFDQNNVQCLIHVIRSHRFRCNNQDKSILLNGMAIFYTRFHALDKRISEPHAVIIHPIYYTTFHADEKQMIQIFSRRKINGWPDSFFDGIQFEKLDSGLFIIWSFSMSVEWVFSTRYASLLNVNSDFSSFNHLISEISLHAHCTFIRFENVAEFFLDWKYINYEEERGNACKNMRFVICCKITEFEN